MRKRSWFLLASAFIFALGPAFTGAPARAHDKDHDGDDHGGKPPSHPSNGKLIDVTVQLARPDPAPDADATGSIRFREWKDRSSIEVDVANMNRDTIFSVKVTKGDASEELGKITIKPRSEKSRPHCFKSALDGAQETPPVDTKATGDGMFAVSTANGLHLRYQVKVDGLSGPPTAATIRLGATGTAGDVVHTLDEKTLTGVIDITEADRTNLEAGNLYVEIETAANPKGEIRGQIAPCHPPVPDKGGHGTLLVDTAKGGKLPFGATSVTELGGMTVEVLNPEGKVVLTAKIDKVENPPPPVHRHHRYAAALDGAQETPAVDTKATGTGKFTVFSFKKHLFLYYEVTSDGLSGPVKAAHIHKGARGVPGDVVYPLDATKLFGILSITEADWDALESGGYYVNLHTDAKPDGEIRGQIEVPGTKPPAPAPVPAADPASDPANDPNAQALVGDEPAFDEFFFDASDPSYDAPFRRGDVNQDGEVNIGDPIATINILFAGAAMPSCEDAVDANDDGKVDISDAVTGLSSLFQGSGALPAPGADGLSGSDPTPDDLFCNQ